MPLYSFLLTASCSILFHMAYDMIAGRSRACFLSWPQTQINCMAGTPSPTSSRSHDILLQYHCAETHTHGLTVYCWNTRFQGVWLSSAELNNTNRSHSNIWLRVSCCSSQCSTMMPEFCEQLVAWWSHGVWGWRIPAVLTVHRVDGWNTPAVVLLIVYHCYDYRNTGSCGVSWLEHRVSQSTQCMSTGHHITQILSCMLYSYVV